MPEFSPVPHFYTNETVVPTLDSLAGKKATVMGLGLNGGGVEAVRFLLAHGVDVTVTDMKNIAQLATSVASLTHEFPDCERLHFVLGRHEIDDFENADFVIKNPGVKYDGNKYLAVAKSVETDLSLFLRYTHSPIIAVTGSKGKSSTVSAIHYGLKQAGFNAFLGGNITVSPLSFFDKVDESTPVVLELSSWQLADLRGRNLLKPHIAVITKIVPDHQNWYGDMESYVNDKKLIYADQSPDDYLLCEANDKWGDIFASESKAKVIQYTATSPLIDKLSVPGRHMRQNVSNAAIVLSLMGVPKSSIAGIMEKYSGIAHRLEFFHEYKIDSQNTVKFYNDSASTVPESTAAALSAFDGNVVLLTGGTDKGLSFDVLAFAIGEQFSLGTLKSVYYLAGTGTDKLLSLLKANDSENSFASKQVGESIVASGDIAASGAFTVSGAPAVFNSLAEMLEQVKVDLPSITALSDKPTVVVFSPGATSFGMFNNEFDRGNKFKEAVLTVFKAE